MRNYVRGILVFALAVTLVVAGLFVYGLLFPQLGQTVDSENWAGYIDQTTVNSANGSITLPSSSDWQGTGTAALWVGMGGSSRLGLTQWPFWQAGATVSCSPLGCSVTLFDEGGTQGPPCNGVCAANWTNTFAASLGDTITVEVYGSSTGAIAVITVDENGFNTTYHPPAWAPLAGVTSFPSSEWIFESPESSHGGMMVMPSLTPPGVVFSSVSDSAGLSVMGNVQMQGNPNGQSVHISPFDRGSFSAYSYAE